jgi:predicted dehydrogenase
MTRCEFITVSGAVAASPLLGAQTPPRRVRIGFLGVAHSHGPPKLRLAQTGADWEFVGLAEDDPVLRAKHAAAGVRIVPAAELVRRCEVIAVESANSDHFRHARLALEAGCHVHVEKPPATTVEEFRELLALAAARGRLLQLGYMWRHHPGFAKLSEAVRNGWLGEVSLVRATMNSTYRTDAARREIAALPGGGMMELGCHVIDQLVRLMGEPRAVSTTHRTHGAADALADNSVAVFEFPRALGIVHINLLQPGAGGHRTFEVIGSNGTATLRPIEPPALEFDLADAAGPYKKGRQNLLLPKYERYVPEFAELAGVVREGRGLNATAEEDLRVQEWLVRACS